MKLLMKIFCVMWLISSFCIFEGCSSNKTFAGMADFTGCVCTTNGSGIEGYVIQSSGRKTVTSPSGMFVFEDLESGAVELEGGKAGFCFFKKTFDFADRRKVFFIQVQSVDEVYDKVEELIKAGELDQAGSLLDRERKFNGSDRAFKFYEKLIDFKKGDLSAKDELRNLCGGEL